MALAGLSTMPAGAHDAAGHSAPTYEITASLTVVGAPILRLRLLDEDGAHMPARFHVAIDGEQHVPAGLGEHGLRFVTKHQKKKQRFTALYARGSGAVEVPLPADGRRGTVTAVRGLQYLTAVESFEMTADTVDVSLRLSRWTDLRQRGWLAADAHLHYERLEPAHDHDWLRLLAAEDLSLAHFLVLKGGNLPGLWAEQYGYGAAAEAVADGRHIRSGEEYRDRMQGHISLLGLEALIEPVSTGGLGEPDVPYHWPALHDVLRRARDMGAIAGPAHGTALGRSPTGVLDTILGAVDFFEIANTHLYHLDVWYQLLSCGFVTPPAAGTDLPNYPFREPWQPLLGETRMYVQGGPDFDSWKEAVKDGRVLVSSGPLIDLAAVPVGDDIGGPQRAGPGNTVRLPHAGEVIVTAELSSPREPTSLELIRDGEVVAARVERSHDGRVHRWRLAARLSFEHSGWLAARGSGRLKSSLEMHTGIEQRTIAHTAALQVIVGERPIRSRHHAAALIEQLRRQRQRQRYRDEGVYENDAQLAYMTRLFDLAIERLSEQTRDPP